MSRWSLTEEYRHHPASAQGIDEAPRIVAAYAMVSLFIDDAGTPIHIASGIDHVLRVMSEFCHCVFAQA
jgi:hypothetical protein